MLNSDSTLTPRALLPAIERMAECSARGLDALERTWREADGAPVFTVGGRYTARGWTEWTQGFQFGSAILHFDLTGEERWLEYGRRQTLQRMASHVSHVGVHDHGFNNVSTYGNLWRLMREERIPHDPREQDVYELALKVSGAVQAARWTRIPDGGFIYSFNGPHSLFSDTIRSLRSLALAQRLGHFLMGENDRPVSLLQRLIHHVRATAKYNVYFGEGRDIWDIPGRVVHESVFNTNDGAYRCPSSQQGYSPFTTWTRGLAWIMLGCAEQLEFLDGVDDEALREADGAAGEGIRELLLRTARITFDFYIAEATPEGIVYWDTGAPGLLQMGDYRNRPAEPFNDFEPVDSSAAAIACQALLRLGNWLIRREPGSPDGACYRAAGLSILRTLLEPPYLNADPSHQGLLLHAVYHRPRGWDHIPPGRKVPCGESCQWGDYHLREAALLVAREARGEPLLRFFGP